jgi:hypothetical protein
MDYADAVASFSTPLPTPLPTPAPTVDASAARRLRDSIEPIAMHSIWSRTTNERLAGLGLNFITSYVWGRAASLGEPEAGVVVSTFAVFQPDMIAAAYEGGRAAVARDVMLAARAESTIESLTATLGDADVSAVAATLQAAVGSLSGMGRPLFSGLRDQPWPSSPIGVLWRGCELAREHRGDGHIAVCLSEGLDPVKMNVLTELFIGMPLGSYSASRAWSADQIADAADDLRSAGLIQTADGDAGLTVAGLDYRREIEARTDALDQPLIDAIGDLEAIIEPLQTWSQRCIDAGSFPPDPFKRAAG